ncbi:hypothetical protein BRD00_08305 [Halobacteriales archaeon QS_8_69_26]|nr:MAG: hypothetical protein BRD00_08305 [Halobacteriales archaeon QS_8_69_26]
MTGPGSLPEGSLVHSRVVSDPCEALSAALDRSLTGYAVLEPQDVLLLDADDAGVIAFRDGVPVAAVHAGTGRGGPEALADLAAPGPYSVELRATDDAGPSALADRPDHCVPPGMPAERLAGDQDLADRTRTEAPRHRDPTSDRNALDRNRDPTPGSGGGGPGRGTAGSGSRRGEAGRPTGGSGPPGHPDPGRSATGEDAPRECPVEERPTGSSPDGGPDGADAVAAFLDDERKIEAIREQASRQARRRADEWGLTDQLSDEPVDGE